jgi:uncharacterized protein (TIGR02466 family)
MNLQRIDVYATPIWMIDIPELEPYLELMIEKIRNLRSNASTDLKQKSNRKGWHSDLDILEYKEFSFLKNTLIKSSKSCFDDYGIDSGDRVFSFSGWANVHDMGGHNTSHVHPGSWLSGTIYLKTPEGAGKLFFEDPRQSMRMEHIPLKKDLPKIPVRSRGRFHVHPKACRLIMFPSWFEHGVEAAECDERISVAFNITPIQLRKMQHEALEKIKNNCI